MSMGGATAYPIFPENCSGNRCGIGTVSYTHLDVYKRQAPGCNILPLNRTAPFKHAAVPASGEIHVMDAGGAEGVEYPPITLWVIQ